MRRWRWTGTASEPRFGATANVPTFYLHSQLLGICLLGAMLCGKVVFISPCRGAQLSLQRLSRSFWLGTSAPAASMTPMANRIALPAATGAGTRDSSLLQVDSVRNAGRCGFRGIEGLRMMSCAA